MAADMLPPHMPLDTSPGMLSLMASLLRASTVTRGDLHMAAATLDQLAVEKSRAGHGITPEVVEAFRRHLWATWGTNRQTTDWPSEEHLLEALEAAAMALSAHASVAAH